MNTKKNLVLADCNEDKSWTFLKGLNESTGQEWKIVKLISNANHGSLFQNLIRYIKYFILPFRILLKKDKYDNIVAWQQFFGIILAFYLRLIRAKKYPTIVVMTFIYKEKKSFIGVLYRKFIKFSISSKYIKKIAVYSEKEVDLYSKIFGIPKSKFVSVKLGIEDSTTKIPMQDPEDFYLSVGRSNRDYYFLVNNWTSRFGNLKIICDSFPKDIKIKNKIEVLTDCHELDYFKQLSKCKAVIIPLDDEYISSGQLAIIQSFMYGKPVLVTKNYAIEQYIVHSVNGYVVNKNQESLKEYIELLKNDAVYMKLSKNSRKSYLENFSLYDLGVNIGKLFI